MRGRASEIWLGWTKRSWIRFRRRETISCSSLGISRIQSQPWKDPQRINGKNEPCNFARLPRRLVTFRLRWKSGNKFAWICCRSSIGSWSCTLILNSVSYKGMEISLNLQYHRRIRVRHPMWLARLRNAALESWSKQPWRVSCLKSPDSQHQFLRATIFVSHRLASRQERNTKAYQATLSICRSYSSIWQERIGSP